MPKVRTLRTKKPPPGYAEIEATLLEFSRKMKDAENTPHEGLSKRQSLWPIFQISHQRSRYIYELFYKRESISEDLYQWLLKQGYADGKLIAKWKKNGYEKLCCLQCIQSKETNFNGTCICRVPRAKVDTDKNVECITCGCRGCCSGD
ncbi:Pre-mRNA-splicing factor cwf14 [Neolecta irregularis DAH-3]|uniref:Pre-mRNA-splicing factor cwf14 n=1 Tax=Neolecta irregularis (strain DAH-3) TaxID=1198029 RepID=A0A1U7LJY6_NEOID|nr:Pre-mRNA-splicing factor cwf14 [Neolecta irregularis DAH-3]|eukprot:OLL22976.1 Pre-mRNA-splicing factor cwf14 [Neolecta irregularis DAH-3]